MVGASALARPLCLTHSPPPTVGASALARPLCLTHSPPLTVGASALARPQSPPNAASLHGDCKAEAALLHRERGKSAAESFLRIGNGQKPESAQSLVLLLPDFSGLLVLQLAPSALVDLQLGVRCRACQWARHINSSQMGGYVRPYRGQFR